MSSLLSKPLASRFELLSQIGEGGMGSVWKARDLLTKQLVAVKLLNLDVSQPEEVARFEREIGLLAELRHPGIVRYIAHGQSDAQAFLVMEWLEGQDLAARLTVKPLSTEESGTLLRRVAEVLSVAHQSGVIHRDVKPSNLFLRHGRPDETTVLDFGVARRGIPLQRLTRTGVVVGTPEYMAPEQARGLRDITYSADLFALGCVAFELLTGRQAFTAQHITGLLTKILFEPAPRLRTFRPDLPAALDELIAELLEKDPLRRPVSASAVYERLCQIEFGRGDTPPPPPPQKPAVLSGDELKLTTLILATAPRTAQPRFATLDDNHRSPPSQKHQQVLDHLRNIGVHAVVLADGSLCASLIDASAATDQVLHAARAATILRSELPDWFVVLSTGMCAVHGSLATGPGFEQSQRVLHAALASDGHKTVWLDELSAELLTDHYHVVADSCGYFHLGARLGEQARRKHQLPLVGLERELTLLHAALHGVRDDEMSRAVLVIGAPGSGKTRLYEELLSRIRDAGEDVAHLSAKLEPQHASAPFATLIAWLRSVEAPDPRDHSVRPQWQKWLFDRYKKDEATQVQHVLSALLHHALPRPPSTTTHSLPGADSITDALAALCVAASASRPLLLVIDNLHWMDGASRAALEGTFLRLADTPTLLLGLSRPEIDELLPRFLDGQPIDRVRLGLQPNKVADKLLAHLEVEPAQRREELMHSAACVPLYLQWLAKDEQTGLSRGQRAVIAMMQSRSHRLDPQAKQVLRAACLLTDRFTQGELLQLLPTDYSLSLLDRTLAMLTTHDWLEWIRPTTSDGELTLRFRSPLLARAISDTLTDEDRHTGAELVAQLRSRMLPNGPPIPNAR